MKALRARKERLFSVIVSFIRSILRAIARMYRYFQNDMFHLCDAVQIVIHYSPSIETFHLNVEYFLISTEFGGHS